MGTIVNFNPEHQLCHEMRTLNYPLLILFFTAQNILGQNNTIDSLQKVLKTEKDDTNKVNTLNALSTELLNNHDNTKARQYAGEALFLSDKVTYNRGKRDAYINLGSVYKVQENYAAARNNYFASLKIDEEMADKRKALQTYDSIGSTYFLEEDNSDLLKNNYAILRINEELNDKPGIAHILQEIGGNWDALANDSEALKYYVVALKAREEIGDKAEIAQTYYAIGGSYFAKGNYTEALNKYSAAEKIYEELGPNAPFWGIPVCYSGIGSVYQKEGDRTLNAGYKTAAIKLYSTALKNYMAALKLFELSKWEYAVSQSDLLVGGVYNKLNKFSVAKTYLEKALQLSVKINNRENMRDSYLGFSIFDSGQGNFKQAYQHYKMYILYRDSLVNEESTRKSLHAKMEYEFGKKEDSVKAAQDKKDALSKAEIKNQKTIRNFSYAGTFAIFGLAGFGFYRFRKRKKLQAQQEMMNERLRISRELHDDIGSTLGSISIYSEVAKNRTGKKENPDEVLTKIGTTSRDLIDKMSDIVWSLNPNNEGFEQLQSRMTAFAAMILTPRDIVYEFIRDDEIKKIQLTPEQRKNTFLIFKEAIYNIAKYAESKKVNIVLNAEKNIFKMLIQDDGRGFDMQTISAYNGNGIKNMEARAADIYAAISIFSAINEGTAIKLSFNL